MKKQQKTDPSGSQWFDIEVHTVEQYGVWAHSPEHARQVAAQELQVPPQSIMRISPRSAKPGGENPEQEAKLKQTEAEREAIDILADVLSKNPLPEASEEAHDIYPLHSAAAHALHGIALVSHGQLIPLLDLGSRVPVPKTTVEKLRLLACIARSIIELLMELTAPSGERHDENGGVNRV